MIYYKWIIILICVVNGEYLKFPFYNNLNVEISVKITKNNLFEERCTLSLESNKNNLHLYDNKVANNTEIILNNKNINIDYSNSTFCSLSFSLFSPYRTVISELYNNHIINNKILSFVPNSVKNNNNEDGYIYIGALPNKKNPNSYCEIVNDFWACRLKQVSFVNIIIDINSNTQSELPSNDIVLFSTEIINAIYAPKKYFDYIKDKIFRPIFDKKLCTDNQYFIKCTGDEFFNFFPDMITFTFDNGNTISISKYNLFKKEWSVFTFQIEETDPHTYDPDVWVFGFDFMSQYTTIFDYDNKLIRFYPLTSSSLIIPQSTETNMIKTLLIINTFLIGISIVFILVIIDKIIQ